MSYRISFAGSLLKKAGYKIIVKGITSTNDVQVAAKQLMKETDVLHVPTDNIVASAMTLLGDLSRESGIPVIGGSADMVEEGGLMTYGPITVHWDVKLLKWLSKFWKVKK
ncbi:ABC transporter substrate binding protein [Streptococcus pluranimalium]|uniref:ABC transporter substrate binding protein n=1 Tax=Streptococcus pluranimalium TaxID=82348 RepID=UPI003F68FAC4